MKSRNLSGCAGRSGMALFCWRKNRHDMGCFTHAGHCHSTMTEKRERPMTLFLRIIRHQVGRIPLSAAISALTASGQVDRKARIAIRADSDESPFVIPDADPESIQTLAHILRFSRATESRILSGCARRSGIPVFCSRKNRHDMGCFSHVDR
jgi:hypothetical protein